MIQMLPAVCCDRSAVAQMEWSCHGPSLHQHSGVSHADSGRFSFTRGTEAGSHCRKRQASVLSSPILENGYFWEASALSFHSLVRIIHSSDTFRNNMDNYAAISAGFWSPFTKLPPPIQVPILLSGSSSLPSPPPKGSDCISENH